MPDRYNIYNSDGAYNLSVSQSDDGEWVRYDDIASLIAATPQERNFYPSDIPKLTPDQKGVIEFAMTMMNSGYPRELLRSWVDAPTSQEDPRSEHDEPCKLPPHEVCENSRDCLACGTRIAPSFGVCFHCHVTQKPILEAQLPNGRYPTPQDQPRRFTDKERAALKHLANDQADFFEVDSDEEVTAKHRAVVYAMLAEASESSVKPPLTAERSVPYSSDASHAMFLLLRPNNSEVDGPEIDSGVNP
jgi:hypothetical protein